MDTAFETGRAYARELDAGDPLASLAGEFDVPDGDLYLDGNSLGPLSRPAEEAIDRVVDQWRRLGVRGWTEADPPWFWYGERLGSKLTPLVGARDEEVVVANSTTVNIHTLVGSFLDAVDGRPTVLANDLDFPTDHYAIRAQLRQRGHEDRLVLVESRDGRTIREADVVAAMDDHDVDVLFMPSVLYRSGQLLDVEYLTEAAHERDVLAGFDLAHSIGVVPHRLSDVGVDFAVWCSYKYLNAGPGAVAGLYVNERHFDVEPALAGWWGHEKATQFDMNPRFTPAAGAGAWQVGTVPVLATAPLDGALSLYERADVETVREKSVRLTEYLVFLVDELLSEPPYDYAVGSPRDPDRRGGHVALERDEAADRISAALRERGVVVDFRPPNVVRVCPSPLYTSYEDVWDAVQHLRAVVDDRAFEEFDRSDSTVT